MLKSIKHHGVTNDTSRLMQHQNINTAIRINTAETLWGARKGKEMMETTEGILDDSLKDMRKHAESISCSTSGGKGFLSHLHCLWRLCMRVIHESSHARCLHNTFLGQTPALSTRRMHPEEKASGEVTRVVCFLLSLLRVL